MKERCEVQKPAFDEVYKEIYLPSGIDNARPFPILRNQTELSLTVDKKKDIERRK